MNKFIQSLKVKMKLGYWSGFSMAMYPSQFAYYPINIDFKSIWENTSDVNLYFHIPFCKSICTYCGFFTIAQNNMDFIDDYINKLIEQMVCYSRYFKEKALVKSICFGGGTPNYIPIGQYYKIFNNLAKLNVKLDKSIEPSMEVSPELLTEEYVKGLHGIGIKRLSLGVQSLNLDLKKSVNRNNDYNLISLMEMIRRYDMNVNIDIINGMVGQSPDMFMDTIDKLMTFKPETISIYPMAGATSSMVKKQKNIMSNKEKYQLFRLYYDYLLQQGYYCESNIKFVLNNQSSTHQQKIYEYQGVDTMGIGCAARSYNYHTHYTVERNFNMKERRQLLNEYIGNDFRKMQYYGVQMNDIERKSRFAIYGVLMGAIDLQKYKQLFHTNFEQDFSEQIEAVLELKLMGRIEDKIILTQEGRVYTDIICEMFWSDCVCESFKIIRGK